MCARVCVARYVHEVEGERDVVEGASVEGQRRAGRVDVQAPAHPARLVGAEGARDLIIPTQKRKSIAEGVYVWCVCVCVYRTVMEGMHGCDAPSELGPHAVPAHRRHRDSAAARGSAAAAGSHSLHPATQPHIERGQGGRQTEGQAERGQTDRHQDDL
eukprot:COSAG05_NODE_3793_length_1834_cov_1.988473_2_plen_158_part_00